MEEEHLTEEGSLLARERGRVQAAAELAIAVVDWRTRLWLKGLGRHIAGTACDQRCEEGGRKGERRGTNL